MIHYQKRRKKWVALLCLALILGNGNFRYAKADYLTDRQYMYMSTLSIQSVGDQKVNISKYTKSNNKEPYVMAISHRLMTSGSSRVYNVVGINYNVFSNAAFSMLYVETDWGLSIGEKAFYNTNINYQNTLVNDQDVNFVEQEDGSGVKEIGEYAFAYLNVPNGYVHFSNINGKIGAYAFYQAKISEEFKVDRGLVDEIGEYAFSGMKATSWTLPDFRKIDEGAFSQTGISRFRFPKSVEVIGKDIFKECDNLKKIILPEENHMKEVSKEAFPDKEGLIIEVPAGYEDISAYHFDTYSKLRFKLASGYTKDSNVYKQLAATGARVELEQTDNPSSEPTVSPSEEPIVSPSEEPVTPPSEEPVLSPSEEPVTPPSEEPVVSPSEEPATTPSEEPVVSPSEEPATPPSEEPTVSPSTEPTKTPSAASPTVPTPTKSASKPMLTDPRKASLKKGEVFVYNGLKYRIRGKSALTCLGTAKKKKTITIPARFKYRGQTYLVTKIGTKAFYKDKKLESIKIGNNVKQIEKSAFEQCSRLKKVIFGKNIMQISTKAFYKDRKITALMFQGGKLGKVGKSVFSKGTKKKKVFVVWEIYEKKYKWLLSRSIKD